METDTGAAAQLPAVQKPDAKRPVPVPSTEPVLVTLMMFAWASGSWKTVDGLAVQL